MNHGTWQAKWGWALAVVLLIVGGPSAGWAATNTFPTTGNAGIGTTTPGVALQIGGPADAAGKKIQLMSDSGSLIFFMQGSSDTGTHAGIGRGIKLFTPSATLYPLVISQSAARPLIFGTSDRERMRIDASGNIGIGTPSPGGAMQLGSPTDLSGKKFLITSNSGSFVFYSQGSGDAGTHAGVGRGIKLYTPGATLYPLVISQSAAQPLVFGTSDQERMRIDASGNIGIGTKTPTVKLHVVGDAIVSGNIAAKYQDVAEWVPTKAALAPGTVVIIAPQEKNQVLPAAQPYDTRVAGVISTQPGLLLGEAGDDKAMVAHSGRVLVKVDASYGPVAVGDLLVTSATPGYAMRSTPVDLGGVQIHRPGTLVGKALEPLANGQGEILVLLTL